MSTFIKLAGVLGCGHMVKYAAKDESDPYGYTKVFGAGGALLGSLAGVPGYLHNSRRDMLTKYMESKGFKKVWEAPRKKSGLAALIGSGILGSLGALTGYAVDNPPELNEIRDKLNSKTR